MSKGLKEYMNSVDSLNAPKFNDRSDFYSPEAKKLSGLEAYKELKEQTKTHRWLEQQFEKELLDTIEKDLIALELIKKLNIDPFGWTLVTIDDRYFLRCISGSLELSKENYLILKGQGY